MVFPEDLDFCRMLVQLKPLLPKTKDAIQVIVEELECGSLTSWCSIKPILIELHECPLQVLSSIAEGGAALETFIYSVLALFDVHKYSNISVIADFLEILCIIKCDYYTYSIKEKVMAIRFNDKIRQTNLTTFEMILVFPYKDIQSFFDPESPSQRSLLHWNCIRILFATGEVHLLKAVLSFGATFILPQDSEHERENVVYTMYRLFDIDWRDVYKNDKAHWRQNIESQFDESSRKRLFFVNWVLQVVVKWYYDTAAEECTQSVRILTKSLPEPLITYEEIKNSITKLCTGVTMNDEKLLQFLEKYETYFPEIREVSKPRSLKHLSRFQVRENLRIVRSFPHGVVSLHVPKTIQDYICLKDILL